MSWRLDWWRSCATVLGVICATVAPVAAGPVNSSASPAAKIEEIEKAGVALQKGQVDDAYKLLQEAVKKKPDLPPARLMLARLLLTSKEAQQQGRAVLEMAAGENPDHPQVYLTNASVALADGRVTDTILNCERALAFSAADRWTEDQKKEVRSQARQGLAAAFEARRDWASARSQLAALLEVEPKNGQLRTRLARALFLLPGEKQDDAFQELTQAVKDDPLLEPPTIAMANLWTSKGDLKKAREWLDKAIKAEPNNHRVHLAYANWLVQQVNEIEQAKIHGDMAGKLQPNDVEVQKLQGLVARIQKDLATAEKIFKAIFVTAPGDFFAQNQLALVLADQSDKEQRSRAVQYAEMNFRANQKSPEAAATLGYVYYRVGSLEEALKALQQAVNLSNGQLTPDMAYYLALALADKEKQDEAKKFLKGALEAKGLFIYRKEAQTLLDKLEKEKKDPPKGPMSK